MEMDGVLHLRHDRDDNDLVQARIRRALLWDLDCLHTDSNEESAGPAQQGHRTPDQWTATGESQRSEEWTVRNGLCAMTELSTTCLCSTTAISTALSMN